MLARLTGMLTRRMMLRSAALAGTTVAAPTLLGACGRRTATPSGPTVSGDYAASADVGLARARVPRAIGGSGSLPSAVGSVRAFTMDLYRQLTAEPGNVVCSPYSVAVALAMTRNGARGQTASEMDAVLHAPELSRFNEGLNALTRLVESRAGEQRRQDGTTATVALDVANSLWGQRDVDWQRPFLEALARYYGAGMRLVDYLGDFEGARVAINTWTSTKTHAKIPHLLPAGILDISTRLVLVNALYLKAPWEHPFAKALTKRRPFRLGDSTSVDVEMMHGATAAVTTEGPGWRAARLSYAGGQVAMTVVLPAGDLRDLEHALNADDLATMLSPKARSAAVIVSLPKWTFRLASPLGDILAALGMPTAFGSAADFSPMDGGHDLSISAVQHEAFVAVDEEGTEAAAATAVVVGETSAEIPPAPFVVDRPFLFVIHDVDTATPLFIGRVADPTAS